MNSVLSAADLSVLQAKRLWWQCWALLALLTKVMTVLCIHNIMC